MSTLSDPSRDLRRYVGVFLILVGGAPLLMFSLLARSPGGSQFPVMPVVVAAPFIVAGAVVTAIGILTGDPKRSAQRVGAGAALIIVGDALIFGLRAALV
ncbi:hypothetical protein [Actinoplanes sp. GCM10030250]|uniref:hypothetical protein n=1 Tax=Actinoplanes sp. GCM10030250 TaxID=3273376 RepID=UPI00360E6359